MILPLLKILFFFQLEEVHRKAQEANASKELAKTAAPPEAMPPANTPVMPPIMHPMQGLPPGGPVGPYGTPLGMPPRAPLGYPPMRPQIHYQPKPPPLRPGVAPAGVRPPPGPPPAMRPPIGPPAGIAAAASVHRAEPQVNKATVIEAKPQMRNLKSDITRFVPTNVKVRRNPTGARISSNPVSAPKRRAYEPDYGMPSSNPAAGQSNSKDAAYAQFMSEMNDLMQ